MLLLRIAAPTQTNSIAHTAASLQIALFNSAVEHRVLIHYYLSQQKGKRDL